MLYRSNPATADAYALRRYLEGAQMVDLHRTIDASGRCVRCGEAEPCSAARKGRQLSLDYAEWAPSLTVRPYVLARAGHASQ